MSEPEVWLRGPVPGYDPMVLPVVHSLLQVREDLTRLQAMVAPAHVWARPGGAASIGFHVRHTAGALDRLLTYARGATLNDAQRDFLAREETPGDPAPDMAALVADANHTIERSLEQLRATDTRRLLDERRVGRAGLPSTVLGLLIHAAEHSTRHMGQAITTARILRGA